jgi:hypothetical protein
MAELLGLYMSDEFSKELLIDKKEALLGAWYTAGEIGVNTLRVVIVRPQDQAETGCRLPSSVGLATWLLYALWYNLVLRV